MTRVPVPAQPHQPALPGMPRRLVSVTPSKIAAFEDCPRRYRFIYLDRPTPPKGPPWAHNSLGASLHTALRNWYELPPPRRNRQAVAPLLKAGWVREGYRDTEQERGMWRAALGWLESYVETMPPEPLGVERTVAARTSVIAFSGRADRIDLRDGELVVVDYKTGRSEPGEDDARGSAALALYAFAAERMFRRPCRQVELHHLPTGTVATAALTPESVRRRVQRAEAAAEDLRAAEAAVTGGADRDETFPTRPGPQCGWCDFRSACPAGRTVPAKEPWAAVAGREAGASTER